MKLIYLFLFLLLVPFCFAQELELNKDSFAIGETLIANINTKYSLTSDLTNINVHIYNEYGKEISAPILVSKLTDSKYVVYMTIPETYLGNKYSLRVDNVYYIKDGILEHFVQNRNFTMRDRSGPRMSVDPAGYGIDLSKQTSFILNLKNTGSELLNVNMNYGIDYFDISDNMFELRPGDDKKVTINVKKPGENVIQVNYADGFSYDIRVYATGKLDVDENPSLPTENSLVFVNIDSQLIKYVTTDEVERGILRIKNNWNNKLTNLQVAVSSSLYGVVSVTPETIISLESGKESEIVIAINEKKDLDANYEGKVIITSDEGAKLELPVKVYYKSEDMPIAEEQTKETPIEEVIVASAKTEQEQEKEATVGTILSLIAILVVLIIGIIIFFKMKKASPIGKKK